MFGKSNMFVVERIRQLRAPESSGILIKSNIYERTTIFIYNVCAGLAVYQKWNANIMHLKMFVNVHVSRRPNYRSIFIAQICAILPNSRTLFCVYIWLVLVVPQTTPGLTAGCGKNTSQHTYVLRIVGSHKVCWHPTVTFDDHVFGASVQVS